MKYSIIAWNHDNKWTQYMCSPIEFDNINKAYKYVGIGGSSFIRRVIEGVVDVNYDYPPLTSEEKPG